MIRRARISRSGTDEPLAPIEHGGVCTVALGRHDRIGLRVGARAICSKRQAGTQWEAGAPHASSARKLKRSAHLECDTPHFSPRYGLCCSPQAALCSGGMAASASGEQLGLSPGMTSLLIVAGLPGPGIVCVPDIVMSLDGG